RHKIDAAIGIRLMNEHLIQFLIVESKKPGTDPSNDKKKQLQEQSYFVIGQGFQITVYDIPGSLIGRRRLFRQNVYVPSKMQFKHHTVDYLESLVGIKMLLKKLKSQLRTTEDILNKLVNEGNNNDKLQISMRTQTIVRNHLNLGINISDIGTIADPGGSFVSDSLAEKSSDDSEIIVSREKKRVERFFKENGINGENLETNLGELEKIIKKRNELKKSIDKYKITQQITIELITNINREKNKYKERVELFQQQITRLSDQNQHYQQEITRLEFMRN
ncbi:24656_t:CDS:2, partial [Gigaspora rosea]